MRILIQFMFSFRIQAQEVSAQVLICNSGSVACFLSFSFFYWGFYIKNSFFKVAKQHVASF